MDIPEGYKDIESYDVCHVPAIAVFCDKMGICDIVNKALVMDFCGNGNWYYRMAGLN